MENHPPSSSLLQQRSSLLLAAASESVSAQEVHPDHQVQIHVKGESAAAPRSSEYHSPIFQQQQKHDPQRYHQNQNQNQAQSPQIRQPKGEQNQNQSQAQSQSQPQSKIQQVQTLPQPNCSNCSDISPTTSTSDSTSNTNNNRNILPPPSPLSPISSVVNSADSPSRRLLPQPSSTTAHATTTHAARNALPPLPALHEKPGHHNGASAPASSGASPSATSPSSSMSNHSPSGHGPSHQQQQQQQQHPSSMGYAPHQYSPQGMPGHAPQYGYPAPPGQHVDQYRPSPNGVPPNPLALPSMRSLDPVQQQQQQQQQHHQQHSQHHAQHAQHHLQPGMPIGSTMAPGPHMGYYAIHPQPYGMHDPMAARYGLPPGLYGDPRVHMSSGRHKKRRTKTGCLTCRKRRIKCDETHPSCNNCKKSKRECLGYDPIFKQQPGPAAIQPALNGQPPGLVPTSAPSTSTASTPYTTHPTPTLTPSHPPALASDTAEAGLEIKSEPIHPSNYIDPALERESVTSNTALSESPDQKSGEPLQLRGGGSPFTYTSPSTFASFSPSPAPPPLSSPLAYSTSSAKMTAVDDLIALGGLKPSVPMVPPSSTAIEDVTKVYYEIYVPGLCQFFESQWYNFKSQGSNSIDIFLNNKPLISTFADFLHALQHVSTDDPGQLSYFSNLENRVVWALTKLAYSIPPGTNAPRDDPLPEDDATEIRGRLYVFEMLITGGTLPVNPLMPPPKNADVLRRKEYEFWYFLAELLRQPEQKERDQLLARLRGLLDGRENRDVLYSIAILRELSPRFGPLYQTKMPYHLEENEPRNKLHVAASFIKEEATATGGTTNVIRRFAFLAIKSFIHPGSNSTPRGVCAPPS